MARRLPPLNALRAFEAAGRHLSFMKAAEELHVTPGAISHQVKALEDYLGVRLFRRLNRALELTEAAASCLPKLREGFASLAEAIERVRVREKIGTLAIVAAPSLATRWLTPRLQRFVVAHPDIDVRISASTSLIDVRSKKGLLANREQIRSPTQNADLAIRFGTGDYPDCRVEKLLSVSLTPMCSPRLLEGEHRLRDPQDLQHHALLQDDTVYFEEETADWAIWLEAAGAGNIDTAYGPRFSHADLALEAAVDGLGVALGMPVLAADDLAAGRLITPFPLSLGLTLAYYVVCHEAVSERLEVVAFRNWLQQETTTDPASQQPDA